MTTPDPNWHWDGRQWRHWNGAAWIPAAAQYPAAAALTPYAAAPLGYAQPFPVVTDRRDSSAQAVIAWILTVLTFGYFLPWAVAATRGRSNAGAIGLLNFFLGWTLVGWIAALVMACASHQVLAAGSVTNVMHTAIYPVPPVYQPQPPPWQPVIEGRLGPVENPGPTSWP